MADWTIKTDYLRCNENFYGNPRYDCVLVNNSDTGPYFARILLLLTCQVDGKEYPIAVIQPFISVYKHRNRKRMDTDFELLRVRQNFRIDRQIVSVHTFIRGAVLIPSGDVTNDGFPSRDFFLFDVLDPDMFLRARMELEELV